MARAVHEWGPRATRPLEIVSCAAVPEALQGRELFGCAAGVYPAIPGAYAGALERAAGGTLLLEDVEQLRADLRATLLRGIPAGAYRREGDNAARPIAARSWPPRTGAGSPSSATCPITRSASLRWRSGREDVLPLAAHYLASFAEEAGIRSAGFSAERARLPGDRALAGRRPGAARSASARRCACAASRP